jgi:ankyrin repeat protein
VKATLGTNQLSLSWYLWLRKPKQNKVNSQQKVKGSRNRIPQKKPKSKTKDKEIKTHPIPKKMSKTTTSAMTQLLFSAIEIGEDTLIDFLLESYSIDIEAVNKHGNTPLIEAIELNNLVIVKKLLVNGANPNAPSRAILDEPWWYNPIHIAAQMGNIEVFKVLVNYGANMNVINNDNWTVLCYAARNGSLEIVKYVLALNELKNQKSTLVDFPSEKGWNPLCCAVNEGHFDVAKVFLGNSANPNVVIDSGWTPLGLACAKRNSEMIHLMLHFGANPNNGSRKISAVTLAVVSGSPTALQILLKFGGTIGSRDLLLAIQKGFIEITKLLLEHDAKPTSEEISVAIRTKQWVIVNFLIAKDQRPCVNDLTFLDYQETKRIFNWSLVKSTKIPESPKTTEKTESTMTSILKLPCEVLVHHVFPRLNPEDLFSFCVTSFDFSATW